MSAQRQAFEAWAARQGDAISEVECYKAGWRDALNPVDDMIQVTKEDGNNYCQILSLLGMEEEGDPVREVEKLIASRDAPGQAALSQQAPVSAEAPIWTDEIITKIYVDAIGYEMKHSRARLWDLFSAIESHVRLAIAQSRAQVVPAEPVADYLTALRRLRKDDSRGDTVFRCGYNAALESAASLYLAAPAVSEAEELRAEVTRLTEDRARFPNRPDYIGRMIEARYNDLKTAAKSNEDAWRNTQMALDIALMDAERYRWLRGGKAKKLDNMRGGDITVYQYEGNKGQRSYEADAIRGDALDAAIDAAIAASKPASAKGGEE